MLKNIDLNCFDKSINQNKKSDKEGPMLCNYSITAEPKGLNGITLSFWFTKNNNSQNNTDRSILKLKKGKRTLINISMNRNNKISITLKYVNQIRRE